MVASTTRQPVIAKETGEILIYHNYHPTRKKEIEKLF
jgi:hypothetical protein